MKYELLEAELENRKGAMERTAYFMGIPLICLRGKLKGVLPLTAFDADVICRVNNINCYGDKIKFFYPIHPKCGIKRKEGSINT